MLKRVTKVTSLLAVAASVVSMVPAMATEVKKIDAQEGTVYLGKAKGNGMFIIDGEINGRDDGAVYFVSNGKYTELKNGESGSATGEMFQNKYVEFDNGDYYVDPATGSKIEEKVTENWIDDVTTTVRKNIKNDNDGRFDPAGSYDNGKRIDPIQQMGTKWIVGFSSSWFEYKYPLKSGARENGVSTSSVYSGQDGKYVDADYNLGNFNVATTGASVSIKNTKDTYEIKKGSTVYEVKAEIDSSTSLSEGYDFILRSAKISLWGRDKAVGGAYTNMTSQFNYGSRAKNYDVANGGSFVPVMQKISKAQSSDAVDGIKYAKDVSTYFMTDSDGNGYTQYTHGAYNGEELFRRWSTNMAGIINSDVTGGKAYAQEAKLKGENGYYYVDLGDKDNVDIAPTSSISMGGGMVYCLSDGYVKMWNNVDAFDKLYKVDGSMNQISASNKDNIFVWNEDDKVYSIIYNPKVTGNANGTATTGATVGSTNTTTTAAAVSWVKANDGTWSYNKVDGKKATGWYQDTTGTWYYSNANGIMLANAWAQDNSGLWYYLGSTGAMTSNKWIQYNGEYYYVCANGVMLTNAVTPDGFYVGEDGAWVK
ncbi:N-acetylmuramoyl-L-alanine amidase family protein [Clostridium saccharoperbutylacetonicum]